MFVPNMTKEKFVHGTFKFNIAQIFFLPFCLRFFSIIICQLRDDGQDPENTWR